MLDKYFKHPIFWDFIVSFVIVLISKLLIEHGYIKIPSDDHLFSIISDMSTVSLTMAGFILTLLTVLISFKSANKIDKDNIKEGEKVFDLFFVSKLYYKTVIILKNAIKSLTIIALIGYALKLFSNNTFLYLCYYYCVFGIVVILLTVWRSIVILTEIVKMQESD